MSQFNWTYLAPSGGKHHVGIFHGENTGHVLLYCNSKVVLVDFKVLESKSYSIFVEDELCEISIEKQAGNRYAYGFHINKDVDTPLNQLRKKVEKKHLKQSVLFLATMVLLVVGAYFGFHQFNDYTNQKHAAAMLTTSGNLTSAKVYISGTEEATYNFIANGKTYSDKTNFEENKSMILENGMPLEDGDEFIIQYSSKHPENNKIIFNRPTEAQLTVYKNRALQKYMQMHPEQNEAYCDCLTSVAFELEGINGFATFYLQDLSPMQNPTYNSYSFNRLVRGVPFQKKAEKLCWEFK